jgi:hypothetical protein
LSAPLSNHNDLHGIAIPRAVLLPLLPDLGITCQQHIALAIAGECKMESIGSAQPRRRPNLCCTHEYLTASRYQFQRLEKGEKPLLQMPICLLKGQHQALQQRQIARAEYRGRLCLQIGANLEGIWSVLNQINNHIGIQIDSRHLTQSPFEPSQEARSCCRYASISSREGGGMSKGIAVWIRFSVAKTRWSEPRGKATTVQSCSCSCNSVGYFLALFCLRPLRSGICNLPKSSCCASASGVSPWRSACSRSCCHACSSTSIVSLGTVSPHPIVPVYK